jgi:transposase-like protein
MSLLATISGWYHFTVVIDSLPKSSCHAVRLHNGFTLSSRDVEDLLATRGIVFPHESIRCLWQKCERDELTQNTTGHILRILMMETAISHAQGNENTG